MLTVTSRLRLLTEPTIFVMLEEAPCYADAILLLSVLLIYFYEEIKNLKTLPFGEVKTNKQTFARVLQIS